MRYKIGTSIYHYYSEIAKFKYGDLLTDKEFEILNYFDKLKSTKEIAEKLNCSPFTVGNHKKNLHPKFDTSSMTPPKIT